MEAPWWAWQQLGDLLSLLGLFHGAMDAQSQPIQVGYFDVLIQPPMQEGYSEVHIQPIQVIYLDVLIQP